MSNQLKNNRIMEKFIVLKKIGDFSPTVERTFVERDDAFLFKGLLEKSETYKRTSYSVARLEEAQS